MKKYRIRVKKKGNKSHIIVECSCTIIFGLFRFWYELSEEFLDIEDAKAYIDLAIQPETEEIIYYP